jgi:putative transposase
MTIIFRRLWIALPVIWLCLFGLTPRAYAGVPGPAITPTILTIEPLKALPLGGHPTVIVRLTTKTGLPIRGQTIRLVVNDTQKRKMVTDSQGIARLTLNYKYSVGTHQIKATFWGSSPLGLSSAVADQKFVIKPLELVIRMVPPLVGIQLLFNNKVYTSNEAGIIRINVQEHKSYSLKILQPEERDLSPDMHVTFSRWNDEVFEPNRSIKIFRSRELEAGFIVSYWVRQILVDSAGQLIDPARISMMTLKAAGKTLIFEDAGPHWLPANQLSSGIDRHLESLSISYYLRNIIIDGVNVVSENQQRFHVRRNAIWPIKLLVYSARFSASDALFRFPIGSGIRLEHPDGRSENILFESAGDLKIGSLPRGLYRATVTGAHGMAPPTPLALSQSQDVELLVISHLDMAVVFLASASVALGLLFFGRPQLVTRLAALPSLLFSRRVFGKRVKAGSLWHMGPKPSTTDLTDKEWAILARLLPPAKTRGRKRTVDMREIANAVYYRLQTGCSWRSLPQNFPRWQTVYTHYRAWQQDGTWQEINDVMRRMIRIDLDPFQRQSKPHATLLEDHGW